MAAGAEWSALRAEGTGDAQSRISAREQLQRMSDFYELDAELTGTTWPGTARAGSVEALWLDLAQMADITTRRPDGPELAAALNADPDANQGTTKLGTTIARILATDPSVPATRRVCADVSELLLRLSPPLLSGVLRAEPDPLRRVEFLEHCATRLALPAAFRVAAGFSALTGRPLSEPLKLLLKRMAHRAGSVPPDLRAEAEEPIRATLADLVVDLVARPGHGVTGGFEPITHRFVARQSGRAAPEAERVVQIAIEADAMGDAVLAAVDELASGGVLPVIELIRRAPAANAASAAIMKKVASPGELNRLLNADPLDEAAADALLQGLGLAAARTMLEVLAESRQRATRRYLLDRLATFGSAIQPMVEGRLKDSRWFVQRNMLALLRAAGCRPGAGTVERLLEHKDSRIRREVLLWLLEHPETKELAITAGVKDDQPEVLRPALHAARSGMPQAAVPILARRLLGADFPPGSRVLAIGLLGRSGSSLALEAIFKFGVGGKTFLGKPKLAAKSPEMLAAVAALARTWRSDRTAAGLLAQARKSRDPEIVAAARTGSVEMS